MVLSIAIYNSQNLKLVICLFRVCSICPLDRTQSSATTSGQGKPESNGNKGVLCIPQSSSITGVSPSDYLVSYTGHSLEESYPFAEMQSLYSTALLVTWNSK